MPALSAYSGDYLELERMAADERMQREKIIKAGYMYYRGEHKRPLKVRTGQPDDNVIINLCGKLIDQSTALLFPGVPKFQFDEDVIEETPTEKALREIWDANNGALFLNNLGTTGGVTGHCFVKVLPPQRDPLLDSVVEDYPRFVLVNPRYVTVFWQPDDMAKVTAYMIAWSAADVDFRQDIVNEGGRWRVIELKRARASKWEVVTDNYWNKPYAPILDWQNLPDTENYYGQCDLQNPGLNDSLNFIASNTARIIKYHASPKTVGIGIRAGDIEETAVDAFWAVPNPDAKIMNLEMQSDLSASLEMMQFLQAQFWAEHRGVDLTSIKDRLGQLTNFGLRVFYEDLLKKTATKQWLYGDAIIELNRRALDLMGLGSTERCEIVWPEPLPINRMEQVQVEQIKLEIGVISPESAALNLGIDWTVEGPRVEAYQQKKQDEAEKEFQMMNAKFRAGVGKNAGGDDEDA